MGTITTFIEDLPFSSRLKSLDDDELLDIWEETQQLERLLRDEWDADLDLAPEYEKLIVQELQLRLSGVALRAL